jgi:NDP-sugar pyrophosphorylase family protein
MALHPKTGNTFEIKGRWLDIGSKETLEEADKFLRNCRAAVLSGSVLKRTTRTAAATEDVDPSRPSSTRSDQIGPNIFAPATAGLFLEND